MAEQRNGARPVTEVGARLRQIERSLGAPLAKEVRTKLRRRILATDRELAELAAKHPLPDQTAPDFLFRPVPPTRRGHRDG